MAVEQDRVEVLADERVLEPTGHPVQHGRRHLHVEIGPQVSGADPELHELERPVPDLR